MELLYQEVANTQDNIQAQDAVSHVTLDMFSKVRLIIYIHAPVEGNGYQMMEP